MSPNDERFNAESHTETLGDARGRALMIGAVALEEAANEDLADSHLESSDEKSAACLQVAGFLRGLSRHVADVAAGSDEWLWLAAGGFAVEGKQSSTKGEPRAQ